MPPVERRSSTGRSASLRLAVSRGAHPPPTERGQWTVRDPKWKPDRVTMLPAATVAEIHEQLTRARILHQEDLASRLSTPFAKFGDRARERAAGPSASLSLLSDVPHRLRRDASHPTPRRSRALSPTLVPLPGRKCPVLAAALRPRIFGVRSERRSERRPPGRPVRRSPGRRVSAVRPIADLEIGVPAGLETGAPISSDLPIPRLTGRSPRVLSKRGMADNRQRTTDNIKASGHGLPGSGT